MDAIPLIRKLAKEFCEFKGCLNQNENRSQARWCIPVIPAFGRTKQEDCDDLQARLDRMHEYQYYIQGPVSITITKIKQKPKATKEGVKRQEETLKRELEKSREIKSLLLIFLEC